MLKRCVALGFSVVLLCGLTGCSSLIDKVNNLFGSDSSVKEPDPLPDLIPEVTLEERWSESVGVGQGKTFNRLTPAVYGNEIFVADVEGFVVSLDRFNGDEKWSKETHEPVSGGVSAGYGLVLMGTLKGEVLALDVSDGSIRWRAQVNSEVLAPPAINGDIVLVQTQDDHLIALDMDTGSRRWTYESTPAVLTLRGTSMPVLTNQLAIAGLSTGKIIALETQRGMPIWEQQIAIPKGRSELERVVDIDGTLLISGGQVYAVSYQGQVAALDLQTGQEVWQHEASSYVGVAKGYGSIYLSLASGEVEGIDERSNRVLWTNKHLERRQLSAPVVLSSYVAIGDADGYLHLLSQIDGRFVGREEVSVSGWQFGPPSGLRVAPVVEGDWVYCYGNNGSLVALSLKSTKD